MHGSLLAPATRVVFDRAALAALLKTLVGQHYSIIGPKVTGTAITYQPIASIDDLPRGWTSEQAPGRYRLKRRDDAALFAYGPAVESLKRYVHPPLERLFTASKETGSLTFDAAPARPPKLAIVGVRPCELEAIARLDKVFLSGPAADPNYRARREAMFIVAANCTEPGDTCFCASMQTGPRAKAHFDLALTELPAEQFLVQIGTPAGAEVMSAVPFSEASADAIDAEQRAIETAKARMGRQVDLTGLPELLAANLEHPEWDEVAKRCLACANCTMSCPTCFCHTIEDRTDLSGAEIRRDRRWDTCFSAEFSYIHGGSIRPSIRARYRQWLTHKFSSWVQQFGTAGCVGCGRCITWCPAGIDVTQEIQRLRGQ